jgi:hypothetical protein
MSRIQRQIGGDVLTVGKRQVLRNVTPYPGLFRGWVMSAGPRLMCLLGQRCLAHAVGSA